MAFKRLLPNLFGGYGRLSRHFPAAALARIRESIAAGETRHSGEVRFAVESRLAPGAVLAGMTPRARAEDVFSLLRVWDTAANNGVLIYLLLAEHAIEIVPDRGVAARVAEQDWRAVCDDLAARCAAGEYEDGVIAAIQAVHALLARHFPPDPDDRNELPDEPILL